MDNQKAIEILKLYDYSTKLELTEGHNNHITDRITVEEFIQMKDLAIRALEKQIPRIPLPIEEVGEYDDYICPNDICGKFVNDELHCCDKCGQRLKWSRK